MNQRARVKGFPTSPPSKLGSIMYTKSDRWKRGGGGRGSVRCEKGKIQKGKSIYKSNMRQADPRTEKDSYISTIMGARGETGRNLGGMGHPQSSSSSSSQDAKSKEREKKKKN